MPKIRATNVGGGTGGETDESVLTGIVEGLMTASPAYCQDADDEAVQLDSTNKRIATKIVPRVSFKLQTLSRYITAVGGDPGSGTLEIYSDGTAVEPNGDLNDGEDACHEDMTTNSLPVPLVAEATSEYSALYIAAKNFDGGLGTWRSADVDVSSVNQNVRIDLGAGNGIIVNRYGIVPSTSARPTDWTLWGSNEASPSLSDDGDWTQVDSQSSQTAWTTYQTVWYGFTNATAYRHYRIKITGSSGTGVILCRLIFVEAQSKSAPGSLLQALGTLSSGSGADWTRLVIASESRYQFTRGVPVWIVEKGEASKDYSVSKNRVNTATGSMFPDDMLCSKESTDGGVTWTQSLKDGRHALWNIILNSAAGHVSQLMLGRYKGKRININGTIYTIPEKGVILDCSSLNAVEEFGDTPYDIFVYVNAGILTLYADNSTGVSITDGVEHLTGNAAYRWLGRIAPQELQSGVQGPVDTPDMRAVANLYNADVVVIGKQCPFVEYTTRSCPNGVAEAWNGDDSHKIFFLALRQLLHAQSGGIRNASAGKGVFIGVDASTRMNELSSKNALHDTVSILSCNVSDGYHFVVPCIDNAVGAANSYQMWFDTSGHRCRSYISGLLVRR